MQITVTNTSALVSLSANYDGKVYLAAISSWDSAGVSVSYVKKQNTSIDLIEGSGVYLFTGLIPATAYRLFYFVEGTNGKVVSGDDLNRTATSFTTLCCRPVVVSVSSSTLRVNQFVQNWLSVSVASRPQREVLQVLPFLSCRASSSAATFNASLYPSRASFSPIANPSTAAREMISLSAGIATVSTCSMRFILSGQSASNYALIVNGVRGNVLRNISVQSVSAALPAPVLSSAVYQADGYGMLITFDRETDQAGYSAQFFPCHQIFTFSCAAQSACRWTDAKNILADVFGASGCAAPGDSLHVTTTAKIRAACYGDASSCNTASWPASSSKVNVTIAGPTVTTFIQPVVVLSVPEVIGYCTPLVLDATASSGDGGRAWRSKVVTVTSSSNNTQQIDRLQSVINANFSVELPFTIPSHLLTLGHTYTFSVSLCNFLGFCGVDSQSVQLKTFDVPALNIQGGTVKSIIRSQSVVVATKFVSSPCFSASRLSLAYRWTLFAADNLSVALSATSTQPSNPSIYALPAYALNADREYLLRASVQVVGGYDFAVNATARLVVRQGKLQACIRGATRQTLAVSSTRVIDGRCSYDEDAQQTGSSSLQFIWTCTQTSPIIGDCSALINSTAFTRSSSTSQVVLQALPWAMRTSDPLISMKIDLVVKGSTLDSRTSTATMTVTLLPNTSASTSVELAFNTGSSVSVLGVMNAANKLGITGTVTMPMGFQGNYSWMASPSVAELTSSAQSLVRSTASSSRSVFLSLPGNVLTGGLTYTFSLRVVGTAVSVGSSSVTTASTVVSIQVTVNEAPRLGSFTITPTSGTAFADEFTLTTSGWRSTSLPLLYQFSSLSTISGTTSMLRSLSELMYAVTQLPPGDNNAAYNLTCVVTVVDTLEATTTLNRVVQSLGGAAVNVSAARLISLLDAAESALVAYDIDSLVQTTAAATYFMNAVNCTVPLSCAGLRRQECSSTPRTCGPCLSNDLVGAAGDANTPCYTRAEWSSIQPSTRSQQCASNCSGHGVCKFFGAVYEEEVDSCPLTAVDCVAKCVCVAGYTADSDCSVSDHDAVAKQEQRELLVEAVIGLHALQVPSAVSISSTLSSLSEASQRTEELSATSNNRIVWALSTIMETAKNNTFVNTNILAGVQSTLNNVITGVQTGTGTDQQKKNQTKLVDVLDTLFTYAALQASTVLVGEDDVSVQEDTFRLATRILPLESGGTDNCSADSVVLPSSALEEALNVTTRQVSVPLCPVSMAVGEGPTQSFAFTATSVNLKAWTNRTATSADIPPGSEEDSLNTSGFLTEALTLQFSSFPTNNVSSRVLITLPMDTLYSDTQATQSQRGGDVYTINCTIGNFEASVFPCPYSSSIAGQHHDVSGTCRGVAETIQVRCPQRRKEPGCFSLGGSDSSDSGLSGVDYGCLVVNYTASAVTCSCPLLPFGGDSVDGSGRRLLSHAANSTLRIPTGTVSVSYVGMLQVVTKSFATTVLSAQSLNAKKIEDSVAAVVTLGAIISGVLVAIFFSYRFDQDAQKVSVVNDEATNKKKKKTEKGVGKVGSKKHQQRLVSLRSVRGIMGVGNGNASSLLNKRRQQISQQQKTVRANPIFSLAEEALPNILSAKTFWSRAVSELKRHHRWFGVVYFYSPHMPRMLRVVSLATNIIIMLFMQSITYNITKGDDGSCALYKTETACLQPSSPYASGSSKCYWEPPSSDNGNVGSCDFVQPDNDLQVVLFIAIFSAIVSTPLGVAVDWLVMQVLCAPLVDSSSTDSTNVNAERDAAGKRSSITRLSLATMGTTSGESARQRRETVVAAANHEFTVLAAQLQVYHQSLRQAEQRKEFQGKVIASLLSFPST